MEIDEKTHFEIIKAPSSGKCIPLVLDILGHQAPGGEWLITLVMGAIWRHNTVVMRMYHGSP